MWECEAGLEGVNSLAFERREAGLWRVRERMVGGEATERGSHLRQDRDKVLIFSAWYWEVLRGLKQQNDILRVAF